MSGPSETLPAGDVVREALESERDYWEAEAHDAAASLQEGAYGVKRDQLIERISYCSERAQKLSAALASPPPPSGGCPRVLTDYEQRWLASIVQRLEAWRSADHEDHITLSRHEVITLLEAAKAAAPSPATGDE